MSVRKCFPVVPRAVIAKSQRESNLELLRIIALLLIIADHFAVHSGDFSDKAGTIHTFVLNNLQMCGQVGVSIFVLISGYFLCRSRFRISRILKIELQLLIYSLLIVAVVNIFHPEEVTSFTVFTAFFPTSFHIWWFATAYMALACLAPFLNKFLASLTLRQHLAFIGVLGAVTLVLPTLTNNASVVSGSLGRFVLLYAVAAFIRFHPEFFNIRPVFCLVVAIVFFIFPAFVEPALETVSSDNPWHSLITWTLTSGTAVEHVPSFVAALGFFLAFRQFNLGRRRVINFIASTTFGVYLFHEQPLMRNIIWMDIVKAPEHYIGLGFYPFLVAVVIAVFLVGMVFDLIRHYVIQNPLEWAGQQLFQLVRRRKNSRQPN